MTLRVLLIVSTLAAVAPAAVKRDDYSSSTANSPQGSQPVYSPPASASSYSSPAAGSSSQNFQSASQPSAYNPSAAADHQAAASSQSYAGGQNGNQGNLYYYYYPVQDKAKDAGGYQASASNQYSSSVTPGADSSQSSHIDSSASASAANPSDLSYSAQDLTYSAQALNPGLSDYQGSAQASANYDQALSSLASQLTQQYGYASANQQQQQVPQQQQQQQYQNQPTFSYEPSMPQHVQEQAGQYSASNPVPNYGVSPNQATFIPANQGQAHGIGGFNPAAQAAAAYAQYQNQMPFGNFAQGSVPQPTSFEPAASGYRRYGIGSFIMPMLALAGLSLLIPTVTSLTASGRKKRSIDESAKDSSFGQYFERLERYYSLYKTAVEREECMNRIICELGDTMSGNRGKNPLLS